MAEEPALVLEKITRAFGSRVVVDDVSLSLPRGSVTALLGHSGCGKSTTLRIAAGVDRQTTGRVLMDGALISSDSAHLPAERRNVGLMFQDFALFPHLTVLENVCFGLKGAKADQHARAGEMLARVTLSGFERKFPHELSGGEQQRVALARALAPGPKVLLMDEPFSGLDDRLRDAVRDATLDLVRAEGTTVMLVTHDPDEAMRMADNIALLRGGRLIQQGAPYAIYTNPADRLAAGFFSDINIIEGVTAQAQVTTAFGRFLCPGMADGTAVEIVIRPQHVKLDFDRNGSGPSETPQDGMPARGQVIRARFMGRESLVDFRMDADGSVMTASVPNVFVPREGTPLWLSIRRDRCLVFPKS